MGALLARSAIAHWHAERASTKHGQDRPRDALWEPVYGPDHPNTLIAVSASAKRARAASRNHLARVAAEFVDEVAARRYAERVLASRERTQGSEHVSLAAALQTLARLDLRGGDLTRARAHDERALALLERAHGADSAKLFEALGLVVQIALADGRTADALALAERSLAVAGNDAAKGKARLNLARVRWERGAHQAARADASTALAVPELRGEVEAWLAGHPLPERRPRRSRG